ncbi:MAG TPA: alpha/beta fold hydrolase [Humidesulfovibrio sp.]|uniref:thioesterase II family protein n=1 Tax=Humidesulfovibrio sp. TaxID=2910988 RepID=UPI002BC9092F|nr:alpha/beta fold hydrolase [Humidesulfovibrio sp.]HWR02504.1 alpha/beta fold hydrolase [Humidesulfovibrio sp.]
MTTAALRARASAPAEGAAATLYCIPHAGGNAAFYATLGAQLPATVVCRPLELPGRGRRHREPLHTSMEAMARDLCSRMAPQAPYALFGHSMGALLALLCAIRAQEDGLPPPRALFLSAAAAPVDWEQCRPPALASLPSQALWDRVAVMGGLPEPIAASQEFLKYLEPILRADLAALEAWNPTPIASLPVPITVFLGDRDTVTEQQARQWRRLTSREFRLHVFPGDHFYLQDHWRTLADHISRTLDPSG